MAASGMTNWEIAAELGVSEPEISQQLNAAQDLARIHPEILVEAAGPILSGLAEEAGYRRLAVFGSVARGEARFDSDIDLVVEAPEGTLSFGFIRFKRVIERTLGREVDLVDYDGLKPGLDDDIRRDAVFL